MIVSLLRLIILSLACFIARCLLALSLNAKRTNNNSRLIILYGGWFGSGNIGDEAILAGLLKLLSLYNVVPIVITSNTEEVKRRYKVATLSNSESKYRREPLKRIFRTYYSSSAFLLTGGTPLYDWDHLIRMLRILPAILLGKKISIVAISAKPIRNKFSKLIIRMLLGRAHRISVREPLSALTLYKLYPRLPILCPDPSILLNPIKESRIIQILEREELSSSTFIIICPRCLTMKYHKLAYHEQVDKDSIRNLINSLAKLVRYIVKQGYLCVFIPFHKAKQDNDLFMINIIIGMLENDIKRHVKVLTNLNAPEEIISVISKAKCVIGMRLHSIIFSALVGTPFIGISYEPKVYGFAKLIGAEKYIIDLKDISYEKLLERIRLILNNDQSVINEFKTYSLKIKNMRKILINLMEEMIL